MTAIAFSDIGCLLPFPPTAQHRFLLRLDVRVRVATRSRTAAFNSSRAPAPKRFRTSASSTPASTSSNEYQSPFARLWSRYRCTRPPSSSRYIISQDE